MFQLVIFCLRVSLNSVALIYLLYDSRHVDNWEQSKNDVIANTVASGYSPIGLYMLLASLVLYYVSYQHQKMHIRNQIIDQCDKRLSIDKNGFPEPKEFPVFLFGCSMISIINFSLDFPASNVPSVIFSRVLVCAINSIVVLIILFLVFFEVPFKEAWGCYAPYQTMDDYNYGLCPLFLNRPTASCCDQPGVNCAQTEENNNHAFSSVKAFIHMALSVSFGIYIISANSIIAYITVESTRVKCKVIDHLKKKST